MDLKGLIEVARGDAQADLVLTNARIVNTFTGEIEENSVAVHRGRVAGVGDYTWARRVVDLEGRFLAPGLIDGHVHLESTYLHVDQFARAVVPRGTLAAVTDLHEVTNVSGPGRYALHHGLRSQSARRPILHGPVLRSRHPHGDIRRNAGPGGHQESPSMEGCPGSGRDHELPWRHRRR